MPFPYRLIFWNGFFFTADLFAGCGADVFRVQWIPKDPIGHHPTVGKKDVGAELDGDHLDIDLDNDAFDPAAYAIAVLLMIAKDFDCITHLEGIVASGGFHVCELGPA